MRKALPEDYAYVIEELITEKQRMPDHNQKSSGIVPEKKNKITVDKHNCL